MYVGWDTMNTSIYKKEKNIIYRILSNIPGVPNNTYHTYLFRLIEHIINESNPIRNSYIQFSYNITGKSPDRNRAWITTFETMSIANQLHCLADSSKGEQLKKIKTKNQNTGDAGNRKYRTLIKMPLFRELASQEMVANFPAFPVGTDLSSFPPPGN